MLDSLVSYLQQNPNKQVQLLSFFTADEAKEKPTIATDRAMYIKKMIDNKLGDTSRVSITQAQVEELFENNKSTKGIEINIVQSNENDTIDMNADTSNISNSNEQNIPSKEDVKFDSIKAVIEKTKNDLLKKADSVNKKPIKEEVVSSMNVPNNYKTISDQLPDVASLYTREFQLTNSIIESNNETIEIIDEIKAVLEKNPNAIVYIIGNTNNTLGESASYTKGKKWAFEYKKMMLKKNLEDWRIKCLSKGLTNPINPNDSPQNKVSNNRIQIIVQ
jgi:outer membrane protein OmpA-like peptidoglycan-associated protein